ncbi:MAG: FAD-dependent oxidoreductase [Jatrophihabitantaceae bacterium]
MATDADVVIVGAGLAGAATAWAAARRGLSVLLLEQFAAGHDRGSSHGSARIVRRAYGDTLYTQLTGRAFELWAELGHDADAPLLRMHGGLDFGVRRDVPAIEARLAEAGVEHELLDIVEAEQRWPGMRFDGPVVYHPQAGTLDAAAAVTRFVAQASALGAEVRHGSAARTVHDGPSGARVELADGTSVSARCAVIAAGAWAGPLLDGVLELPPLRVTQHYVFHFPRRDLTSPPWPSVIHEDVDSAVYHLAGGRDGGPGDDRKVAEHDHGTVTSALDRDGVLDAAARSRVVSYVQRWLPGLDPGPRGETTCLYTETPSEDFLLDRVGSLVVCSPCSGHGAKFAPLIGELTLGLVTGDGAVPDRFRLASHALSRPGAVSL